MKALILMDSFKGCLTSSEAGASAAGAFGAGDDVRVVEVSDGGEGFMQALTRSLGGYILPVQSHDPLGMPIQSAIGIAEDGMTAVVDTASAGGLGLVPPNLRSPLRTTSYGTGELLGAALDQGVGRIVVGLGGSATCDGGLGMLQALGYRLLDPLGREISFPVLSSVHTIDPGRRHRMLSSVQILALYDGRIPLCGRGGAALRYSPQKGASPALASELDSWLYGIGTLFSMYSGQDAIHGGGAGAAGGIGAALGCVLHARMLPGLETFLDLVGIPSVLEDALADDGRVLVITGEGKSDEQTLDGKVPLGILEYLRKDPATSSALMEGRIQVVLLSGRVEGRERFMEEGFCEVLEATARDTPEEMLTDPDLARENIRGVLSGALPYLRVALES